MMRFLPVLLLFLVFRPVAAAEKKGITYYLDSAREEVQLAAVKGYLEFRLPASLVPGSLRIRPAGRGSVERVVVAPTLPEAKAAKEQAALVEKKGLLEDRLKTLAAREEVFRGAAKTQSGKAPRKSKSNPEPLADIRRGTEFALSQLEEVYRLRRKAEIELKHTDELLKDLEKQAASSVAKVWLSEPQGQAVISYLRSDLRWSPSYAMRLDGEGAFNLSLHAEVPQLYGVTAVANAVHAFPDASSLRVTKNFSLVSSLSGHYDRESLSQSLSSSFSFTNTSGENLPVGEVMIFMREEYMGTTTFAGCPKGAAAELRFPR